MAITAVGTATASNNSDATVASGAPGLVIPWTKTGLAANDVIEARILYGFGSAETAPAPSGWTRQLFVGSTTTTLAYAVFTHVVTQAELDNGSLTSWAFQNTANALDMSGTLQHFRGVDTASILSGTPVITNNTGAPTFDTTLSVNAITTADADAMVSVGYALRTNSTATKPTVSTPPAGYTAVLNGVADAAGVKTPASSSARATRSFYATQAVAGSSGAITATASAAVAEIGAVIAYKPATVTWTGPQIQGTPADTQAAVSQVSQAINLPAGIQAGEKLLVVIAARLQTAVDYVTFDSYTKTQVVAAPTVLASAMGAAYVITATGSEGATTNITLSAAARPIVRVYRFPSTAVFQGACLDAPSSLSYDSPSLSLAGGASDATWLAFGINNNASTADISTYPAGYIGTGVVDSGLTSMPIFAYAHKELNAATEDPGAFVYTGTATVGMALTIAVSFPIAGSFPTVIGAPAVTNPAGVFSQTNYTMNLPAGIQAGEKLLIVASVKGQSTDTPFTLPGLTTTLKYAIRNGTQVVTNIFVADATGSEGATTPINIATAGVNNEPSAVVWRLSGASGQIEVVGFYGAAITPDPPSNNVPWGAADTKWLALAIPNAGTRIFSAWPAGYADTGQMNNLFGNTQAIGWGWKNSAAASEDPGTFTIDVSSNVHQITLAIAPTGVEGETLRPVAISGTPTNLTGAITAIDQDLDNAPAYTDPGLIGTDPSPAPTNLAPVYPNARVGASGQTAFAWGGAPANAIDTSDTTFSTEASATTALADYFSFAAGAFAAIPAGSTINSVTVTVKHRAGTANRVFPWAAIVSANGTLIGSEVGIVNNSTSSATAVPATAGGVTHNVTAFGTMPTLAQLQSSTFGVRLRITRSNSSTYELYSIKVTVNYTPPTGATVNTEAFVELADPVGTLKTGPDTGLVRARIRKKGNGSNPLGRIQIRNAAGSWVSSPIPDTTITETDADGQLVSGTFNQNQITDKTDVVARFIGTGAAGGLAELVGVEWNAQIGVVTLTPAGTLVDLRHGQRQRSGAIPDIRYRDLARVGKANDLWYREFVRASKTTDVRYAEKVRARAATDFRYALFQIVITPAGTSADFRFRQRVRAGQATDQRYRELVRAAARGDIQYRQRVRASARADAHYRERVLARIVSDLRYKERQRSGSTSDVRYRDLIRARSTSDVRYRELVRARANADLRSANKVRAQTSGDFHYALLQLVAPTQAQAFLDLRYRERGRAGASPDIRYRDLLRVPARLLDVRYRELVRAGVRADVPYRELVRARAITEYRYTMRGRASSRLDLSYKERQRSGSRADIHSRQRQLARSRADLLSKAAIRASGRLDGRYMVKTLARGNTDYRSRLRQRSGTQVRLDFGIYSLVPTAQTLAVLAYRERGLARALPDLRYRDLQRAIARLDVRHRDLVPARSSLEVRYAEKQMTRALVDGRFRARGRASSVTEGRYRARQRAGVTFDVRYRELVLAAQRLSVTYRDLTRVAARVDLRYSEHLTVQAESVVALQSALAGYASARADLEYRVRSLFALSPGEPVSVELVETFDEFSLLDGEVGGILGEDRSGKSTVVEEGTH